MVNKRVAAALDDLTQTQSELRFGVKPATSARELSTYRRLAPLNLFYDAGPRMYATIDRFAPLLEHSAESVLTWLRAGFGDNIDQKFRRKVPCESASDLVKSEIETMAPLTRAIAGKRQVKVNYLPLNFGASTETMYPLALADTGLRWHLRAYDRERSRFADFALTRIVRAKALDLPIPIEEQIEADFIMSNGVLALDMRTPLVGYAMRRWSVDCSPEPRLNPKKQYLWLNNPQTLYGDESASLAPGCASDRSSPQ